MISPKKFFFPPEESRNSPGGIEKFLRNFLVLDYLIEK